MSLPSYAIDFRGHPACPCQVEWIPAYEHELQRRGLLVGPIKIYQLIGGNPSSGGTHLDGGVGDFLDLPNDNDLAVWVARQMGADATWHRLVNWDGAGGIEHDHSVLTNCPHNGPARYQITAVGLDFNGLGKAGMGGKDTGPRPLSGRTWQQGIEWAKEQEMADEERMREIAREEIANFKVEVGGASKVKLPAAILRLFERTKKL
jgi:hypothetical protein